jgi:hypothetical protein
MQAGFAIIPLSQQEQKFFIGNLFPHGTIAADKDSDGANALRSGLFRS